MLKLEYGYEFLEELREQYPYTEDYYNFLIDEYGEQFLSTPEIDDEDYALDDDELQDFLQDAAEEAILPENINIKNNWMNRVKQWIKDRINNIKNTFQR